MEPTRLAEHLITMAIKIKPLLRAMTALTAMSVLVLAACSSDPVSLISGESDEADVSSDAEDASEAVALSSDDSEGDPSLIGRTPMSRYLIEGTLWSEAELSSLRGTAWVLFKWWD
jgi:hypothetical protein